MNYKPFSLKKSKFGNIKYTDIDGTKYDSGKEYQRASELQFLQGVGAIKDLKMQVKFVLIPSHYENKKCIERECSYVADFTYTDTKTNEFVVEDVKGFKTEVYKIKRKLMLHVHGIKIREI